MFTFSGLSHFTFINCRAQTQSERKDAFNFMPHGD
jgi:hypothetical protein